jgi:hypothetical protein
MHSHSTTFCREASELASISEQKWTRPAVEFDRKEHRDDKACPFFSLRPLSSFVANYRKLKTCLPRRQVARPPGIFSRQVICVKSEHRRLPFPSSFGRSFGDSANDRIQPGTIPAAGNNANFHFWAHPYMDVPARLLEFRADLADMLSNLLMGVTTGPGQLDAATFFWIIG